MSQQSVPAELFRSGDPADGLSVWEEEGGAIPADPRDWTDRRTQDFLDIVDRLLSR